MSVIGLATDQGTATASPRGEASPPEVLVATGIEKSFRRGPWPLRNRQPVLRGATLAVVPGEVVGLAGENGSGKSTLMKILVGALAADAGTVVRTGRLGYCPQEPLVYARLTVDEHFELFGHAYRMTHEQAGHDPNPAARVAVPAATHPPG